MSIDIITNTQTSNKNKKIKEQEACEILYENPQCLRIFNVSRIRPSKRRAGQFYCFIDFRMEDGTTFGISYSFNRNNDKYFCGASSKLYNLMSGFMGLNPLNDTAFRFEDVDDIEQVLLHKNFFASIKIVNIGGKAYPFIICERVIE